MPILKEISVSYGRKCTRNYQTMDLLIAESYTMEEGEDIEVVKEELMNQLMRTVDRRILAHAKDEL